MTDESDEVLNRVEDGVGFVTLNRPKAINSLNQGMVDELRAVLGGWEQDTAVGVPAAALEEVPLPAALLDGALVEQGLGQACLVLGFIVYG